MGSYRNWENFELSLANLILNCCPIIVNGQILNKKSSHLITLKTTHNVFGWL